MRNHYAAAKKLPPNGSLLENFSFKTEQEELNFRHVKMTSLRNLLCRYGKKHKRKYEVHFTYPYEFLLIIRKY